MKYIFLLVFLLESFLVTSAENPLFIIERSKDADEVHYVLNTDQSKNVLHEDPIQVFWLKKTDNNKEEALTWIQNKYSYGIVYLSQSDTSVSFQLAAYD